MGLFQIQVPDEISHTLPSAVWDSVHFCGSGGTPWQTQVEQDGNSLKLRLKVASSGKIQILWPVQTLGLRLLSTCTLPPSDTQPYNIVTELARGSCHRARTLAAEWTRFGVPPNREFEKHLRLGTEFFLNSLNQSKRSTDSTEESIQAISHLEQAIDALADQYAQHCIEQRKQHDPRLGTLLAGSVIPTVSSDADAEFIPLRELYLQTFNTAAVRLNWRDIEPKPNELDYVPAARTITSFQKMGLRTIAGPVIDFEKELLPEWVLQMADNFDALQQATVNFIERSVTHLKGTVQLWNCISGINNAGPIRLDDEQIMRLSLSILQTVRRADPETPAIISFDQPFGEYLRKPNSGIPGLKVAETLERCGLGLAGIGLDIKLNYPDIGSMQRSAMDFSQNLDRWSGLGLPLLIQLTAPASQSVDPHALRAHQTIAPDDQPSFSGDGQLSLIEPLLQILLAKPYVHGIVWNGWADHLPHHLPNSGLIDQNQTPRPLQKHLSKLRSDHLN